jgi:hypothetical protein
MQAAISAETMVELLNATVFQSQQRTNLYFPHSSSAHNLRIQNRINHK